MYPLLFLFILLETTYICKGQNDKTCNVLPKDPYVEMGSDLDLVCLRSCVKGRIMWKKDDKPLDKTLWTTNASHSVLTLKTVTDQRALISCYSEDLHQILGGTIVRTYTKPSEPLCVLHYVKRDYGVPDRFTCSWEHQPHMKANYTVICESCNPPVEMCSSQARTCTMEDAHISNKIHFGRNTTVSVRATTAAWETWSNSSVFNPFHIFKINPPKLEVRTNSSAELFVTWRWSPLRQQGNICQVKYAKVQTTEDDGNQPWVINTTANPGERGNVTIEKLQSCSSYTFAVRCALDRAPWSDWSQEETMVTKLHKGDVQLKLWRKIAEPDRSGTRKVRIMWKEIPSTCRETLTYSVQTSPCEDKNGVNCSETSCRSSTCDLLVDGDAHRINLTVSSDETPLVEDSVYVPAVGESLPQATNIQTLTQEGVIRVSWDAPLQPVSGYVIDYTHDGNQYQWKESSDTNTTLTDLLDMKPYDITVTPVFGDRTGHGTRALHVCSRVGEPGNITITNVHAHDRSAHVSWTVKSQEPCSGAVVNYTVYYGKQEGPRLSVNVNIMKCILEDLDPDTHYSVYVEATALTGTTQSSEHSFKTTRFNPKLITALSVSGVIAIVLVLCLGLCCAFQWKKFQEKPVPNPGLSSVALWQTSHQKGTCLFPPFTEPSESSCERVYMEDNQTSSTSSLARDHSFNPAGNCTEGYANADVASASDTQKVNSAGDLDASSSGESTTLLSSDNGPGSPYRSQSSGETSAPESTKLVKRVPGKQLEKAKPVAIYVTMDMFKQGHSR